MPGGDIVNTLFIETMKTQIAVRKMKPMLCLKGLSVETLKISEKMSAKQN